MAEIGAKDAISEGADTKSGLPKPTWHRLGGKSIAVITGAAALIGAVASAVTGSTNLARLVWPTKIEILSWDTSGQIVDPTSRQKLFEVEFEILKSGRSAARNCRLQVHWEHGSLPIIEGAEPFSLGADIVHYSQRVVIQGSESAGTSYDGRVSAICDDNLASTEVSFSFVSEPNGDIIAATTRQLTATPSSTSDGTTSSGSDVPLLEFVPAKPRPHKKN